MENASLTSISVQCLRKSESILKDTELLNDRPNLQWVLHLYLLHRRTKAFTSIQQS